MHNRKKDFYKVIEPISARSFNKNITCKSPENFHKYFYIWTLRQIDQQESYYTTKPTFNFITTLETWTLSLANFVKSITRMDP